MRRTKAVAWAVLGDNKIELYLYKTDALEMMHLMDNPIEVIKVSESRHDQKVKKGSIVVWAVVSTRGPVFQGCFRHERLHNRLADAREDLSDMTIDGADHFKIVKLVGRRKIIKPKKLSSNVRISRRMATLVRDWHAEVEGPIGYHESSNRISTYFNRLLK